jgi:2-phospho-L-lactate guanylyltransferase
LNDGGHGLNTEIASATHTLGDTRVAVIHGDLPFLTVDDVSALLASGENGYGIAPDRHGSGTNAMALRDACGFSFGFGQNSFHYHSAQAKGRAQIIRRHGLAFDIDTADDLADAVAAGWRQHR